MTGSFRELNLHENRQARLAGAKPATARAEPFDGPVQIKLGRGQVWSSDALTGRVLTCLYGSVWLTQEADGRDIVLEPMMRLRVGSPGLVVVEGLDAAVVEVR
jgi:hypothetical protein